MRRNRSRASLIRECIAAHFAKDTEFNDDSLTALIGTVGIAPAKVDDVVYGR